MSSDTVAKIRAQMPYISAPSVSVSIGSRIMPFIEEQFLSFSFSTGFLFSKKKKCCNVFGEFFVGGHRFILGKAIQINTSLLITVPLSPLAVSHPFSCQKSIGTYL